MQHEPLGKALKEYAGAKNRSALLSLLLPIQQAAEHSTLISELVDSGEVYHALAWSPHEAYRFLQDIPVLEESGLVVRVPDWWKSNRPPRPAVNVKIDARKGTALGVDALLEFSVNLTLDGEPLTENERKQLLESVGGLVALGGSGSKSTALSWLRHLNTGKTSNATRTRTVYRSTTGCVCSPAFLDRMMLRYPSNRSEIGSAYLRVARSRRCSGKLRTPEAGGNIKPAGLLAQLREYQQTGVSWLRFHRAGTWGLPCR